MQNRFTHAEIGSPGTLTPGLLQRDVGERSALRFGTVCAPLLSASQLLANKAYADAATVIPAAMATGFTEIALNNNWLPWPCTPCFSIALTENDSAFNIRFRITGRNRFGDPIVSESPWVTLDEPNNDFIGGTPIAIAQSNTSLAYGGPIHFMWADKCFSYVEKLEVQVSAIPTNYVVQMGLGTVWAWDRCSGVLVIVDQTITPADNTDVTIPLYSGGAWLSGAGQTFTLTYGDDAATVKAAIEGLTGWPAGKTVQVDTMGAPNEIAWLIEFQQEFLRDHLTPDLALADNAGTFFKSGFRFHFQDNMGLALPVEGLFGPSDGSLNGFPDVVGGWLRNDTNSAATLALRMAAQEAGGVATTSPDRRFLRAGVVTNLHHSNWEGEEYAKLSIWSEADRKDAAPASWVAAGGTQETYNRQFYFQKEGFRVNRTNDAMLIGAIGRGTAGTGRDANPTTYYPNRP